MKRFTKLCLAGTALSLAAAGGAQADELKISSWAPPSHPINSQMFPNWGDCVNKESDGALTYKIEYNLAPPPAQFNVARKGIADVAWIFHGYNAGRYVATKVAEFPGAGPNATAVSVAYQRTQEKYLDKLNEHRGVHLLSVMSHGPAVLQTRRPVTSMSELKGMKLRLPGGVATQVFTAFGAVPVKVPAPKVYEVLSTGVADGVSMPIETQKSFKLAEVVKNVVTIPGGFYFGSFAIIMNPRKYSSLKGAPKAAVDKCSGVQLAKYAGAAWDGADKDGRAVAEKEGNVKPGDAAMREAVAKVAAEIEAKWVAEMKKKGMDNPEEALEYLREQAAAYK